MAKTKSSDKKMTKKERIQYWIDIISADPEYYLDTESYSFEDIYEYAVEMADNER